MNFTADSHTFSPFSKLSDLEVDLALCEQNSSQILRRQFRNNPTRTTLTYSCQDKQTLQCSFSLVYVITVEAGVEWAKLLAEKSNFVHSHISKKNCSDLDFESMRRCFKVLEQPISNIVYRNPSILPIDIMEYLILGEHLTEAMKRLKKKYPKRFKKCLDNQTYKIKRKIKGKRPNGSESTIKTSNSSSNFFPDQNLNFFVKNDLETSEGVNNGFDETKILFEEEDENILEASSDCLLESFHFSQ